MVSELYLIGFVQAVFFSALILAKKNKDLKDFFLTFFILIMGFNLLFLYASETEFYKNNPLLILFDFAYWTLIGPALYLYIYLTVSIDKKLKIKHLLHLLPAIAVFISYTDYIINIDYYKTSEYQYNLLSNIGYFVLMYNTPVYYILSVIKLRKHKKSIKDYYSYKDKVDLKWLYFLTNGFAFFLIFLLGSGILKDYLNVDFSFNIGQYTWLIMIVYIFGIGFFGYKQKGIFSDFDNPRMNNGSNMNKKLLSVSVISGEIVTNKKNQYQKSGLSTSESKEILEHLINYMTEKKPFLDWELNLKVLADYLNTTTHKLSQAINENLEQSFYEFINKYRVEEVKRLLSEPKNSTYKIISLAYDTGFNSKSSFYTVFKKYTNKSPIEYRKQYLQNA